MPDSQGENGQAREHRTGLFKLSPKYYVLIALLLLAGFLGGAWYGAYLGGKSVDSSGRRILHYVDPMNPAHTSKEPGLAPCGMKMEPVYADEGGELPPPLLAPGSVKITPRKQQLIGVRLGEVKKAPYTYTLRALGRVAIDENRIYRLNSFVDGWIEKTYPKNTTGSLVMKGNLLASYYSRDTLNEVQLYIVALTNLERVMADRTRQYNMADYQIRLRQAEDALKTLGMTDIQIQELAKTRLTMQDVFLSAPVTSFVISRNVSPGQKIVKGEELFKLADLSRVWIEADLYENEAAFITPGLKVRAHLPYGKKTFWAEVTDIQPEYDKVSRTLRVRLEADNPDYALKPEMFVDVEIPVHLPPTITVPVDAVMDTGLKKTVFVDRGQGYFEPRRVETGWRHGDRVQITKGLKPGERIVISGNFLVDSESRMKLAAAGFVGEVARDPVVGTNLDVSKARAAGLQTKYGNQIYYFHTEETQRQFLQNPERYLEKMAQAAKASPAAASENTPPVMAKDPVCGIQVDKSLAKAKGLTSDYQGQTYYFCRFYCNEKFDKDPGRYVKGGTPGRAQPQKAQVKEEKAQSPLVKDPVCGVEVNREQATTRRLKRVFRGHDYYFCRDYCAREFDKNPERYTPELKPTWTPPSVLPRTVMPSAGIPKLTQKPPQKPGKPGEAVMVDPVTLEKLNRETIDYNHSTFYQGKIYYFANDRNKEIFDLNPQRYLTQHAYNVDAMPETPQAQRVTERLLQNRANQQDPRLHGQRLPLAKSPAPGAPIGPQAAKPQVAKPVSPPPAAAAAEGAAPSPPPPKISVPEDNKPEAEAEKWEDMPYNPYGDPVCGVWGHKDKKLLPFKTVYRGKTYYFCSEWCKEEFTKNPKLYAKTPEKLEKPKKQVKAKSTKQKSSKKAGQKKKAAAQAAPEASPGAKGPQHD